MPRIPRVALTPGEPAGLGPDLALMLTATEHPVELVALADPRMMAERAEALGLGVQLPVYDPAAPARIQPAGRLPVAPVPLGYTTTPGDLRPHSARYVLATLQRAVTGCLSGEFDALVTGPVHKGMINEAGFHFTGHTEYLAAVANTANTVMMLAVPGLRVALATTHLPLRDVPDAITPDGLRATVTTLHQALVRDFGLSQPRILVCGLNPHAGEGGYLGQEELTIITPLVQALQTEGLALEGPLPADTLFTPERLARADAVLAMYHDQGLPVLKHKGFGRAVNITLGLPFIRTSVDHGTAVTLAGTGQGDPGSLEAALTQAIELIHSQRKAQRP